MGANGQDCGCDDSSLPGTYGRATDASPGQTIDASRTLFRVGTSAKVSDALSALTFVKGSPLMGNVSGVSATALQVQVQRLSAIVQPATYDLAAPTVTDTKTTLGPVTTFALSRFGARVQVPLIDEAVTVSGTTQDYADFQMQAAAVGLIRRLDLNIGKGDSATTPFGFDGLSKIASVAGRTIVSSAFAADVRQLIASITPNGASGTGDGIDCFFGGPLTLRKLMNLAATQGGNGEFRRDFRTGRTVFHYMGIPYYRTETSELATITGGRLYGANLGQTGLQLIHAYGSSDTFGIAVQETPVTAATGTREITVQGAWALVLWENEAIMELNNFDLTATAL